jgi:hypothetical protein
MALVTHEDKGGGRVTLEAITEGLIKQRKHQAEAFKSQFDKELDGAHTHDALRGAYLGDYKRWRKQRTEEQARSFMRLNQVIKRCGFVKHDDRFHSVVRDSAMDPSMRKVFVIGDHISLNSAGWLAEALCGHDCVIDNLFLSSNDIRRYEHLDELLLGFVSNVSVHSLAINSNRVADSSCCGALRQVLGANRTLTSLKLTNNCIGDDGAVAISEVLRDNGALTELNLCNNDIGDAGALALSELLIAQSQKMIFQGGECRASSCEDPDLKPPEKAFDGKGSMWSSRGILPHWVEYDLGAGNALPCTGCSFRSHIHGEAVRDVGPTSYRFEGSNDRRTWDELHSAVFAPEFRLASESRSFECWPEGLSAYELAGRMYRYFRLYISDVPGRSRRDKPTAIRELVAWGSGLSSGAIAILDVSDNRIGQPGGEALKKAVSLSIKEMNVEYNEGISSEVIEGVAAAVRGAEAVRLRDHPPTEYQLAWAVEERRMAALEAQKAGLKAQRLEAGGGAGAWVEETDGESTYYVNQDTGETAWEVPGS